MIMIAYVPKLIARFTNRKSIG